LFQIDTPVLVLVPDSRVVVVVVVVVSVSYDDSDEQRRVSGIATVVVYYDEYVVDTSYYGTRHRGTDLADEVVAVSRDRYHSCDNPTIQCQYQG
jgi:hypothetical protein